MKLFIQKLKKLFKKKVYKITLTKRPEYRNGLHDEEIYFVDNLEKFGIPIGIKYVMFVEKKRKK